MLLSRLNLREPGDFPTMGGRAKYQYLMVVVHFYGIRVYLAGKCNRDSSTVPVALQQSIARLAQPRLLTCSKLALTSGATSSTGFPNTLISQPFPVN